MYLEPHDYRIYYVSVGLRHHYGISAAELQTFLLTQTSPAVKSEEKRMFSQDKANKVIFSGKVLHLACFESEGFWKSQMAYSAGTMNKL